MSATRGLWMRCARFRPRPKRWVSKSTNSTFGARRILRRPSSGSPTGLRRFTCAPIRWSTPTAFASASWRHAEEMLRTMCDGNVLEKVRHFVSHEGNNWHVDVYEGLLDGVVLTEIELADAGQEFALPDWIGAEVTSDPRYRKINKLADHVATQKSADTALLARADEVIE